MARTARPLNASAESERGAKTKVFGIIDLNNRLISCSFIY